MTTSDASQLHVLGAFRLERGGQEVRLARRKAASLLVYLLLHPEKHSREEIATLFWGDSPDSEARGSLRTALSFLRNAAGGLVLIADEEGVQFNAAFPIWCDAVAFKTEAARFLSGAHVDPAPSFLDLYNGDLLPGFYDDWIAPERERLHGLYLAALLRMSQQMRTRSEYERAIEFAQRILALEPANERAHQQMMFCLMALGDRSAALRQYEACRKALQDDLAVEPAPETTALYQWIKGRPAHSAAREALTTNLPIALSSFIGREGEMAEIKRLMARARLLTLVGPGGSGKTRLAVQVGSDLVDRYKDGVWFCDLATVQDPAQAAAVVARTLRVEAPAGVSISDALANFLRSRRALLVLDNFEHVIAACARLAEAIFVAAPQVQILATSREIFDVQGELIYQVPALSTPPTDAVRLSLAELAGFEAPRLFIERASASCPADPLADQDAEAIAAVCRRLDGMPLAIELAAARVRILSVRQIAEMLQDRFTLLASSGRSRPGRHSSLRAAIDWSYDLLAGDEQALLRRLSVFVGGFGLAGAVSVGGGEKARILDVLSRLVDKSLLVVDRTGNEPRFRLLETIRIYAWERLLQAGEKEAVVHSYITFLCHFVEDAEMRFLTSETQVDRPVMVEYDNIRSAMRWCQETGDIEQGLRTATPLWWLNKSEDMGELAAWLETMLAAGADVTPLVRGRALAAASYAAQWQGNFEQALALAEESLALCRPTGDRASIAFAMGCLGKSAHYLGKLDVAVSSLQRSLALYREIGYDVAAIWSQEFLGQALQVYGDAERALALLEDSLRRSREMNYTWGISYALRTLGAIAQLRGDSATDVAHCQEALDVCARNGDTRELGFSLATLADALTAHGQAERAATLWGAASAHADSFHAFASLGRSYLRLAPGDADPRLADLRARLGESVFQELVARGQAMSLDEAVVFALTMAPDPLSRPGAPGR